MIYLCWHHTVLIVSDCSIVFDNALWYNLLHILIQLKLSPLSGEGFASLWSLLYPPLGRISSMEQECGGKGNSSSLATLRRSSLWSKLYGGGGLQGEEGSSLLAATTTPWGSSTSEPGRMISAIVHQMLTVLDKFFGLESWRRLQLPLGCRAHLCGSPAAQERGTDYSLPAALPR